MDELFIWSQSSGFILPDSLHGATFGSAAWSVNYDGTVDNFTWPEQYGIGLQYRPTDNWIIALDVKEYAWSDAIETIKVVGENTDKYAQGYFVYDSKKAGGVTCSHLRFSDAPILSTYLINKPDFVSINAESFIGSIQMLRGIKAGGTLLINTFHEPAELFDNLPRDMQETILKKKLKLLLQRCPVRTLMAEN